MATRLATNTQIADVLDPVDGRAALVESHFILPKGLELLIGARHRIVYLHGISISNEAKDQA